MAQRAFRPFHEQFPEIRFELYENDTYRVIEQLQSKVLDLAIVRTPFQSDNLTCYTLVKEHLLAVGNKKYFSSDTSYNTKHTLSTDRKIATAEPDPNVTISLKELAEHPLIVYHRWLPVLDQHFETLKLQPNYLCINMIPVQELHGQKPEWELQFSLRQLLNHSHPKISLKK